MYDVVGGGTVLVNRGPFRRVALKSYLSRMSKPDPTGLFDDRVAEILEQQGFTVQEDPASVYDPQQLWTALQRFATDDSQYWDRHLEYGFRKAWKIFSKPKEMDQLSPLQDTSVVKALKLGKSSGLPLMKTKEQSLVYSFDREQQIRSSLKAPNPCVAYKRTQRGNKTRLVWGYPLEMTIMEARFARPLIDMFKQRSTPMAFAMTKCELGAKIESHFDNVPGVTVCTDYSKFDSTIPAHFIRRAFKILETWFPKEDRKTLGWDIMVKYFITTPIVMPDGNLYTGKNHGVPSGSYFTQLVDSIVNVAICYALGSRFNFSFRRRSLFVLGDDSMLRVEGKFSVREWAAYVKQFGMCIHDDHKTVIGKNHFLGATWIKGKPDAPTDELSTKAGNPESYRHYDSQDREEPISVLRSYAASYLSAWQFIPNARPYLMNTIDHSIRRDESPHRRSTPAEQFFFEEMGMATVMRKSDGSLSMRILL